MGNALRYRHYFNIHFWVSTLLRSLIRSSSRMMISRQNITLQPTDFLIGPASGNPSLCLTWPQALPPSSDGIDWQLGTPFLRSVYSVFSYGINTKEAPMIGFYALASGSPPPMNTTDVLSFLSAASSTIETTLPNYLLPTPTYTIPRYAFNTSVPVTLGQLDTAALATRTYVPLLESPHVNVSALPTVQGIPTRVTLIITNSNGEILTSTSDVPQTTPALGLPPGVSSAIPTSTQSFSIVLTVSIALICTWTLS